MTAQPASSITSAPLLQARNHLILHQALYAAAKLGVADLLNGGVRTTAELAGELKVNEEALYRTLRALASQGIFEETTARSVRRTEEHTSELQSRGHLVCRLLLEKKKKKHASARRCVPN